MWIYLAVAGALALVAALSVLLGERYRVFVFTELFFLAFLVRSAYYIATQFSGFGFGDAYGQYGVLLSLLDNRALRIFEIGNHPQARALTASVRVYSGWPGLQIVTMALSDITGIGALHTALIMPWVFFFCWFVFAYLLLHRLQRSLGLPPLVTNLGLLVLASWPLFPNMPPTYKYQDMALVAWGALLYLVCRQSSVRTRATTILFTLLLSGLVITHSYTSFMALLYLSVMASIAFLKRLPEARVLVSITLFTSIIILLWWTYFTLYPWTYFAFYATGAIEPFKVAGSIPELAGTLHQLTPAWALLLLPIRDVVMFVPAVVGLFIILKWKNVVALERHFIIYSSVILLLPLGADIVLGRMNLTSLRTASLSMYFIAFLTALSYYYLTKRLRYVGKMLLAAIMILLVFGAFIGFWGHTYAPVHLYDPTVTFQVAGEIPIDWPRMGQFIERHVELTNVDTFLTDQIFGLALALPVNQWDKIVAIGHRGIGLGNNTIVVAFNNLNTASYIDPGIEFLDPNFNYTAFRHSLETRPLIYDDGQFEVWV